MWLKILGSLLFTIGIIMVLIPGFDELLIIAPLTLYFGLAIIPIYYAIGFTFLIIGAGILGVHLLPLITSNPIIIIIIIIILSIMIYIVFSGVGVLNI